MNILTEFLSTHKKDILDLSESKTRALAGSLASSRKLQEGHALFFDQLIEILNSRKDRADKKEILIAATEHGKEHLRLGYSLSHVVHSYGAICQAITELATVKNVRFTPMEFNLLNLCLDVAISAAVSEYQHQSSESNLKREAQHLGFLVHELRNALSSATIAHEMIKGGLVGVGGSTSAVLEENLQRMRNLIDRALSDIRMRADSDLHIEKFLFSQLIDQIVITAKSDAAKRRQLLLIDIQDEVTIEADRHIVMSIFANLIQNAIKYTKLGGEIWISSKLSGQTLVVEVQDECGGIETSKISSLFEAFVQEGSDRSGLGLGLTIVRQAVKLSQGKVYVRNAANRGCSFIVELPLKILPEPSKKTSVNGVNAVQP
ncbi:MAG: sensor histidine kinase [Bradymonadales bacterium]|nr:MAG: sensor histidine kinase [Bradymonadales bacterium]